MKHAAIIGVACLALGGCSAHLHGNQSTSGGATTTTTTSAVSASASMSGGRVAFSSGSVPPLTAPGGQLSLSRGPGAVLLLGVVIVDALNFFATQLNGAPQPAARAAGALPASIADTCSCYGYQPPAAAAPVNGEQ